MPSKRPGTARKGAAKAGPRQAAPRGAAPAGVKQYIAGRLKAMYDEVAMQPIPEQLLELLDRLGDDSQK